MTDSGGKQLVLIGGGGHAKVVADCARSSGWTVVGFYDGGPADSPFPLAGTGVPFLGPVPSVLESRTAAQAIFIAVGDNQARCRLAAMLWPADPHQSDSALQHVSVTHVSAMVSPSAGIGSGTLVAPRAVINADACIGADCIINTSAVIEHDCIVGAATHIAPGTVLGGQVQVGELTLVGLGARVLPRVRIGSNCTIGAGAVVTADVPDGLTVIGVPARPVR